MLEKPQMKDDGTDSREDLVMAQGCADKLTDTVTDTDKKITQIQEAKKKASSSGALGGGVLALSSQVQKIDLEQNFAKIQGQLKEAEAELKRLQNDIALILGQAAGLSMGIGGSSNKRPEDNEEIESKIR